MPSGSLPLESYQGNCEAKHWFERQYQFPEEAYMWAAGRS